MEDNVRRINLEQLMAGALLKFDKVDALDRTLLVQDFEEKTGIRVWYGDSYKEIYKYIERKEGCTYLRGEITLNSRLITEPTTLRKKLVNVAGDDVNNYFKKFNLEKFYKQKKKRFASKKRVLQKQANILLVSSCEEDYEALKNYGFENISYFRSIKRADEYFNNHPEEINNYDIYLRGNHSVFHEYHEFKCINNDNLVEYWLSTYDGNEVWSCSFYDHKLGTSYSLKRISHERLLDNIVINCITNHHLDEPKKRPSFEALKDYINPNKLELPKRKSDLKILFLGSGNEITYSGLFEELGLNVTYAEDMNPALYDHVEKRLGEFDIILASRTYSSRLLYMNLESTEQCKDTGRRFTTLVVYDDFEKNVSGQGDWRTPAYYGTEIKLEYSFGGELSEGLKYESKEYRTIICSAEGLTESPSYSLKKQVLAKNVLEEAVNIYSDTLKQLGEAGIENLDFNSAEDYDKEYQETVENEEKERQKYLGPILEYNRLVSRISQYLDYRKEGYIKEPLVGLRIKLADDSVHIENISQDRILCTMTIPLSYVENDLRVFSVQTLNKKGVLGKPEIVGLYTKRHEQFSVPKRPDDKQMSVIEAIENKVEAVIGPQNDRAYNLKQEIQGKRNRHTGAKVYSRQYKKY